MIVEIKDPGEIMLKYYEQVQMMRHEENSELFEILQRAIKRTYRENQLNLGENDL